MTQDAAVTGPAAPLLGALPHPGWSWGIGVLGAIAEFTRDPDEPADLSDAAIVTGRGGIRLTGAAGQVLVAQEAPSRHAGHWQQSLLLCLPAAAASCGQAPDALTELGPDAAALRPADRGAILFDLGLGFPHLRACVRSADPALLAVLRAGCGRPLLDPGNPAGAAIAHASPHRVFVTRAARIEVFQPIPPPDGRSPEGPHTHLLPALLRHRRTHAATTHLPEGLVPLLEAFPPHAQADQLGTRIPFDPARHAAFQDLLSRHGSAAALAEKRAVAAAVAAGQDPAAWPEAPSREARAARRVALRQLARTDPGLPALPAWRARWDRAEAEPAMDLIPGHG